MKVGIFTPVHKINWEHLDALAISIRNQTYPKYLWYIHLNGDANKYLIEVQHRYSEHMNIKVWVSDNVGKIGALKKKCCDVLIEEDCDILLEVDYDDLLHKDCVKDIIKAAEENPEAVFFFSNFAHFGEKEGEFHSMTYGSRWGWQSKPHKNEKLFGNNILNEHIQFPATPQFLRRIEASPNHLRAFRTEPYRKIEYDAKLPVGDDHDLMCRFFLKYGEKGFHHINKCLYYQRYDSSTTTHTRNKDIQLQVNKNNLRYTEHMFKRWANDRNLLCLDLGGRFNCPKGYKSVDLQDADYIIDLNKDWWIEHKSDVSVYTIGTGREDGKFSTIISNNSVGIIRANHVLEHLDDPIHFFNEAYRVLAPGGGLFIEVPSINHNRAFADPTHKTFWSEYNFEYYCNEFKARFIRPQYKGAFQVMRLEEYAWPDGTLCVRAHLLALKGEYNNRYWGKKETDEKYII